MDSIAELAAHLYRPVKLTNEFGESLARYYGPPLTDEMVANAERELGFKLPQSFLELLRIQNGGFTYVEEFVTYQDVECYFRCVNGLGYENGIDRKSAYMIEEWGHPSPAVYLEGDGHTAVMLDYRGCGPAGEPSVIFVDTEVDDEPAVVQVAPNFHSFLQWLVEQIPAEPNETS